MGSCISKCKPRTMIRQPPPLDLNLLHDKLVVVSQPPLPPTAISLSNRISPYPPSPSASISSVSSFTCVSTSTTNSSVSSATSRFSASRDRSPLYSDEFLWSRYKENPHVVRINSIKANANLSSPAKVLRLNSPAKSVSPLGWQPSPQWVSRSTPKKRVRPRSPSPAPNLTRQKSFKKEERPPLGHPYSLSNRASKSPSPSRRFGGEKCRLSPTITGPKKERNDSRRKEHAKPAAAAAASSPGPSSHNNPSQPHRACSMKKETFIHRISSKIDEVAVRDALSNQDFDSVVAMEDIDNPLISLDCFIFL